MAKQKYYAAKIGDFEQRDCVMATAKGMEIGIYKVGDNYYAWRNLCPHAAAPICAGVVCGTMLPSDVYEFELGREGEIVRCPWHNWEFDLITGVHLADPSFKLRGYELSVEGEEIYILF